MIQPGTRSPVCIALNTGLGPKNAGPTSMARPAATSVAPMDSGVSLVLLRRAIAGSWLLFDERDAVGQIQPLPGAGLVWMVNSGVPPRMKAPSTRLSSDMKRLAQKAVQKPSR